MGKEEKAIADILLRIPMARYASVTVLLPAISLAFCFITGFLFRGDEVNDTDCKVANFIPSVSAVTGIRPQAYVWRICIGLHSAPRFFMAIVHYNHYKNQMHTIAEKHRSLFTFLMNLNFWVYTIECACLLSVSCISNKENYPLHEKIFVGFMVTSLVYMLLNTILFRWIKDREMTDVEKWSYMLKKSLFVTQCLATIGLLIFFIRHRFHCIPGAFSWFSAFEYVIAYTNMGYHLTSYYEFSDKFFLLGELPSGNTSNGVTVRNTCSKNNNIKKD